MEKIDLLEQLKEDGYRTILLTSYSSDLLFFEKMILRHLIDNQCTYIGLLLDGNSVYENFEQSLAAIGTSYVVQPIYGKNVFHPKVYLMLGKNRAKALVGSGNLTPAGFITNTEVFNVIRYDEKNKENLSVIQSIYQFFRFYHKLQPNLAMEHIFNHCDDFTFLKEDTPTDSPFTFLHNGTQSLHEQIKSLIVDEIIKIDIIAPYFDQRLAVEEIWLNEFKPNELNILLQDKTSNFPMHVAQREKTHRYLLDFLDREYKNKRYHGKVFYFKGKEKDFVVYGSANFSKPALLTSFQEGGNAEAVLVESGNFEKFFNEEVQRLPLPEHLAVLENEYNEDHSQVRINFIEAHLNEKKLTVHLFSEHPIVAVLLEDEEGTISQSKNGLYKIVFKSVKQTLTSIFSLLVEVNDDYTEVIGWIHNQNALTNSQLNKKLSIYRSDYDPYLTDYQNIVNILEDLNERLALTAEDLEKQGSFQKHSSAIHSKAEISDKSINASTNIEDYYVDEEELARETYGSIGGVDVISELIRKLITSVNLGNDETSVENKEKDFEQIEHIANKTKVLEGPLRKSLFNQMRRFTNKFKEGICSDVYMNKVSEDVFITNIVLYNQFLLKLYNMKSDVKFISKEDLIEEFEGILQVVVKYGEQNIIEHHYLQEVLLPQFISVIIVKDMLVEHDDPYKTRVTRSKLKENLVGIHKNVYPLHNYVNSHSTKMINFIKILQMNVNQNEMASRIEKLTPFLTKDQFDSWFNSKESQFKLLENDSVTLRISSDIKMGAHFNLIQLIYLAKMLAVEEWENESIFKIVWINESNDHNLKKYILYYHREKKLAKKKFVYRNGLDPLISQKTKLNENAIKESADKGDASLLSF